MWMQREMKSKITKDNLLQLKEKKINQLRVNKIKLKKNSKDSNGEMQTSGLIITKESFTIIAELSSRMTQ